METRAERKENERDEKEFFIVFRLLGGGRGMRIVFTSPRPHRWCLSFFVFLPLY